MDAERDSKENEVRRNAETAKTIILNTRFPVGEWGRKAATLSAPTATDWYESGFLDGVEDGDKARSNRIAALRWSPPNPITAGTPEKWLRIELGPLGQLVNKIPTPTAFDWYGAGRIDEQESTRTRPSQDLTDMWEDLINIAWAANKDNPMQAEQEARILLCLTRSYSSWIKRGMEPLIRGQIVFTCSEVSHAGEGIHVGRVTCGTSVMNERF